MLQRFFRRRAFSTVIRQVIEREESIGSLFDLQVDAPLRKEEIIPSDQKQDAIFPSIKEPIQSSRFIPPEKPIPFSDLVPPFQDSAVGRVLQELGINGVSLDRIAERHPKAFHLDRVQVLQLLQHFKDSLGITTSEFSQMVVTYPRILSIPEQAISSTLEFLTVHLQGHKDEVRTILVANPTVLTKGFSVKFQRGLKVLYDRFKVTASEVKTQVLQNPKLLSLVEETRVTSFSSVLESQLDMSVTQTGKLLRDCLELLRHTKFGLKERIAFLMHYNISRMQAREMILKCPAMLNTQFASELRHMVNYLEATLNADRSVVKKIVSREPSVFLLSTEHQVYPNIAALRNLGFSQHEIGLIFVRCPGILLETLHGPEIRQKLDFLHTELDRKLKDLVIYPTFLVLSMEEVILPRVQFLRKLGRQDYEEWPLMKLFGNTDEEFCTRHVKVLTEKYKLFKTTLSTPLH